MMCQSVVGPKMELGPCPLSASYTLFGVHLCGPHDTFWRRELEAGQKIKVDPERTLPHGSGALERIGMRKIEPPPAGPSTRSTGGAGHELPLRPHRPPADGSAEQAPTPPQRRSIPTLCPHCGGRRADALTGRCLACGKRACSPDLAREFGHPIYERPTPEGGAA